MSDSQGDTPQRTPREFVAHRLATMGRSLAGLTSKEPRPEARKAILQASMLLSDIESDHYRDPKAEPPMPTGDEPGVF